jgi:transposase
MQTQNNKLDFNGQNIYVGFDVHLKSWTVTILTDRLYHKTFNQPPQPKVLYEYLSKNFPGAQYHTAYEAGFCGYWIHNTLKLMGVDSMVVNPSDIPTTDKEKVQKEDSRDSRKIARALKNGHLKPIHVPAAKTLEDRGLVRTRSALVKDLTRNKNRVKSFLHFHGIEIPASFQKSSHQWSKRYTEWLKSIEFAEPSARLSLDALINSSEHIRGMVLQVTGQINSLAKTPTYSESVELLKSIPGIGLITAMIITLELETIHRFESVDKLSSFIGLIPSTHSSGEHEVVGDITRRGHSMLRNALVESAWVAARIDPALNKSYHSYCNRMDANKAIIRIAKKLVSRIRYVLKNKTPYVYSVIK